MDMVINHDFKPWDWDTMSNPNITIDFIEKYDYLLKPFDDFASQFTLIALSSNPSLTIDFIKKHPHSLNWSRISMNPNMTLDIVVDNPEFRWIGSTFHTTIQTSL